MWPWPFNPNIDHRISFSISGHRPADLVSHQLVRGHEAMRYHVWPYQSTYLLSLSNSSQISFHWLAIKMCWPEVGSNDMLLASNCAAAILESRTYKHNGLWHTTSWPGLLASQFPKLAMNITSSTQETHVKSICQLGHTEMNLLSMLISSKNCQNRSLFPQD